MSDSVRPHRWQPTRLPHPWDSPGKNTGVGCHFLLQCMKVKSESEFAQSCPTLRDPMDSSLPGSSIHGVFQARVLEWGAITFSKKRPINAYKESWASKNWSFWTVVLAKTLESPLDHKKIQPVHPKGDQSWIFIGNTDVKAETPILCPPDEKNWLIWKDPDAGKDWSQEEKGTTEDEMVRWHEFEYTPGVGDGQGVLACCSPWGHKDSDMTNRLNWEKTQMYVSY